MTQRKKDKYCYKSILADHIKNGHYELSEPLDFNKWLDLIKSGKATERQDEEKPLRFISNFVDKVKLGQQPEREVMEFIAQAFYEVINHGRWEDAIPLPWTEISMEYSRAEIIDLELWGEVSSILYEHPDFGVIPAITKAAENWCTSYEKARAAYYKYKKP